ncbi:MAG: NarK/NasA family nitrate transporter [Planctomycetes bacterium]|nr:NarK/NasA family nitrate transporter [Planctomycetota bacterium]
MKSVSESGPRTRVLLLSTTAFTLLFNVWLMLGVLGIPIRKELALSDTQLEWLIATAILAGSLLRLSFGIWADRFGGRNVFVALLLWCAVPTYLFSRATSYWELLLCALGFGTAGNAFSAGVAWCSNWYPQHRKGTALGIFGAGNVGAAGTKLLLVLVPSLLTLVPAGGILYGVIPGGWRFIPALYSALLVLMAGAIVWLAPTPDPTPARSRSLLELMQPLRHMRVWRFGLYYVVVFGAYVAMSGWLPKFYVDTFGLQLRDAALLTALFIFPASLLRPLGGYLSDRFGPRGVTYAVFAVMFVALLALAVPSGSYFGVNYALNVQAFTLLILIVGCGMGIGKASVFKYIPNYFPSDVGAVGGLVGMLGALGGFFLPPLFGWLGRTTGMPQMAFAALAALTGICTVWLHAVVVRSRSQALAAEAAMAVEGT